MQGLVGGTGASAADSAASSGFGQSLMDAVGSAQQGNFGDAYGALQGEPQQPQPMGVNRQAGGVINPGQGRQRYQQLMQSNVNPGANAGMGNMETGDMQGPQYGVDPRLWDSWMQGSSGGGWTGF